VDGSEICLSLIQKVINDKVTFLDRRQQEIIKHLPVIGEWAMVYRKYQGEGYVTFEKWKVVDIKTFHDFTMKHFEECKDLNLLWPYRHKKLVVIAIERDTFHHSAETYRKIALARLKFVEEWLANN
jgi:hypothetical protein